MAIVQEYPCGLPDVLIASLAVSELPHARQNDVQLGPPRYELLNEITPAFFDVSWSFDQIDFQVFEGWFKAVLNFGVNPFTIGLPVGQGTNVEHECNMLSYQSTRVGRRYSVTTRLTAVEKVYVADDCDALDLIVLRNGFSSKCGDLCDVLTQFVQFGEVDLPAAWGDIQYGTDFS